MSEFEYITITELNQLLNKTLVERFPLLHFSGEISQLTIAASGHMYFTLKDEKSQMPAVMWRGDRARLDFEPEPGMSVLCHSKPNIYHASGRLQMVVSRMLPAGEGLLQKKFLELKEKLEAEGVFAPERKRSIPFLPRSIGVVTSASGAVIHDIMTKITERFPQIPVKLIDVRVQGEGAAGEIARAIERFQTIPEVDVLIVGRGGGSLEDLWPFNEEVVVRAIFASRIPVVSAVGHEVDVTLSDLVADERAPTPTAAAEMVVPKREDLLKELQKLEKRLQDISTWFSPFVQQVDELAMRLDRVMRFRIDEYKVKVSTAEARLALLKPHKYIAYQYERLSGVELKLIAGAQGVVRQASSSLERLEHRIEKSSPSQQVKFFRQRVDSLAGRLKMIHPEQVLKRGYAIARHNGSIVRSVNLIQIGDSIEVSLADGSVRADVKDNKAG